MIFYQKNFQLKFIRKKQGFEPPLDLWLKGPLKDWAYDIVEKSDDLISSKNLDFYFNLLKGEKIDLQIMELNNV